MIKTKKIYLNVYGLSVILIACSCALVQATPSGYLNIMDYGATRNDSSNDRQAIINCINAAKNQGKGVYVPNGTFRYNDTITFNGVNLRGEGHSAILKATSSTRSAIFFKGDNLVIESLAIEGSATSRTSDSAGRGISVADSNGIVINNVKVSKVSGAGIMFVNGSGRIENCKVFLTKADGIHMTKGSDYVAIKNNLVYETGDDGIAIVSYYDQPAICHDILIENNEVKDNLHGRGITCVGGNNNEIVRNTIRRVGAAGILIAAEGGYNTYGINQILVRGNDIYACGSTSNGHGAIHIANSTSRTIGTVHIDDNNIYNAKKAGIAIVTKKIDYVNITNTTIDGTDNHHGIAAVNFNGRLRLKYNTIKSTSKTGLTWVQPNGGKLEVENCDFLQINKSRQSGNDVIKVESGNLGNLKIRDNTHTQLDYPLQYFLEERVSASQTISGNSSSKNSYINGASVPTP